MKRPPFFAQFDGEDINGMRYGLGDEIDADTPGAILDILADQGRIAANKPTVITAPISGNAKSVDDMSRAELEGSALSILSTQVMAADDDKLRSTIEGYRAEQADKAEGAPADDAKPLDKMTTAELEATAADEEVTFGDDVKTNAQRAAAIQAARDAKG